MVSLRLVEQGMGISIYVKLVRKSGQRQEDYSLHKMLPSGEKRHEALLNGVHCVKKHNHAQNFIMMMEA